MVKLSELNKLFQSRFIIVIYKPISKFLILSMIIFIFTTQSALTQTPNFSTSDYVIFPSTGLIKYGGLTHASFGSLLTTDSLDLLISLRAIPYYNYEYQNLIKTITGNQFDFGYDYSIYSAGLVDFNLDGNLDVFITGDKDEGGFARSALFRNNGDKTFSQVSTDILNFSFAVQDWHDFDNDGDYDLIISGQNVNFGKITKIYRNDQAGLFTEVFTSTQHTGSVAWWDFNNDGVNDFVIGNKIFKNLKKGGFQLVDSLPAVPGDLAVGDYDEDGDIDIVCGYQIINNSNNQFTVVSNLDGIDSKNLWADFDNDGDLDLLHGSTIYHNDGNNIFSATSYNWFADSYNRSTNGLWIDFDGDSDLDIWFSKGWNNSKVYLNSGIPNSPPGMPDSLQYSSENNKITFSWTGASDNETDSSGLTYNIFVGTFPYGSDIVSPMSNIGNGVRKIMDFGNVGSRKSFKLEKTLPEGIYYWGVQTIDNSFTPSAFKTGPPFEIK
jgi:hypothetical protein